MSYEAAGMRVEKDGADFFYRWRLSSVFGELYEQGYGRRALIAAMAYHSGLSQNECSQALDKADHEQYFRPKRGI